MEHVVTQNQQAADTQGGVHINGSNCLLITEYGGTWGVYSVSWFARANSHSPRAPLIQCEACATQLNEWSWEVGGQST